MNKRRAALLSLAFSAAACATASGPRAPKPPDEYRLADGTLVVCRMEADTGSNYRTRVCRRVEGTTPADRSATDELLARPAVQVTSGQ